ncbi:MAG: ABC transporter ATP-binding protein [Ornithinimicrobium sp.]
MLDVSHVSVSFGDFVAVDQVSLHLPQGRVLAILGPSGCGKSTLLRAIAGLEHLAAGTISFDGRNLEAVPTHARGFALMFQDGQLFAQQSVADNVGYALRLQGVSAASRRTRVAELLDLVGLEGAGKQRPSSLSGGEQQRVALARALAAQPRLLLLDEPLSALDRELRERLAGDLHGILQRTGTTTLMVTHDHDEAFAVADDLAVMMGGRLVQQGPAEQVWGSPGNEQIARFLGYAAVLQGAAASRVAGTPMRDNDRIALRRWALRVTSAERRQDSQGRGSQPEPEPQPARTQRQEGDGAVRHTVEQGRSAGETGHRLVGVVQEVTRLADQIVLQIDIAGVGRCSAAGAPSLVVARGDDVVLRVDPDGIAPLPQAQRP